MGHHAREAAEQLSFWTNKRLEFCRQIRDENANQSSMKTDDQRGVSVILIYTALLFLLLGFAGRMKAEFHYRVGISNTAFIVAAVLAGLAILLFLFSLGKKRS
jgi:hypothetical protein